MKKVRDEQQRRLEVCVVSLSLLPQGEMIVVLDHANCDFILFYHM